MSKIKKVKVIIIIRIPIKLTQFNSNLDVVDEAFEYLISKSSKGEKCQYFTPRYVIEVCVKMLNPQEHETMIDTEAVNKNDVQLRDDLIFTLLYPSIQKELKKQYGEIKQNECGEIIRIKRLPIGTYLFNVTVQIRTFEDAHNPPNDLVTITFSNEKSSEWQAIDFKKRRLKPNEVTKYEHPL